MNQAEAQAEAVRRWGVHGKAGVGLFWMTNEPGHPGSSYREKHFVSCGMMDEMEDYCHEHQGLGNSFESAFANADARTKTENQTNGDKGGRE